MMAQEREFLKNYVDNAVLKIEELIGNYDKESKEENDAIKATIQELKNYMNTELPNLNSKIDEENEERINNIKTLVDQMNQQFGEVHELIDNERKKREESENSFVQNLEEIMEKVKNEFNKKELISRGLLITEQDSNLSKLKNEIILLQKKYENDIHENNENKLLKKEIDKIKMSYYYCYLYYL